MSSTKKQSLSNKIEALLNETAKSFDPEDDDLDETRANYENENLENEELEGEAGLLSSFRRDNLLPLSDVDQKYAGKTSSRKNLRDSSDEGDSASDESGDEKGEDESDMAVEAVEEDDQSDDYEAENEEAKSDSEYEYEDTDVGEEEDSNFQPIKDSSRLSQVQRGVCVRNQLTRWESLLEMRIQLQKCLVAANKMPQREAFIKVKCEGGAEFKKGVATSVKSLSEVLDKMLMLQDLVWKKYPETKSLGKKVGKAESDEEIPSDTEPENESEEEENKTDEPPKKRRRLQEYETEISTKFDQYKEYRNGVIQKWNDKTNIGMMKSSVVSHTVLNQINHILSDRQRLIKRTQCKRSDYKILGEDKPDAAAEDEDNVKPRKAPEEYNSEIFDDDDFYHQLLRELIEVKSTDASDPVQLGKRIVQLQSLRSKMKRNVDTRATKGRKIRYAVHTKLVNLMAPIEEDVWADEPSTELHNSLFGKTQS